MLIRWVINDDRPAWISLAEDVALLFGAPEMPRSESFLQFAERKTAGHEALIAIDRVSGNCLGIIAFSRTHNRISWLAVFERERGKGTGAALLKTALRQLDTGKEITVVTFREDNEAGKPARALYLKFGFIDREKVSHDNLPRVLMARPPSAEKRGASFHFDYPGYALKSRKEFCPPCNHLPMPDGMDDIAELDFSWAAAEYPGQGHLFGKMHVLAKTHVVHFEEMPSAEMAGFMRDVQIVAKALHRVTGAVKINYEIHANSGPHLHVHLFPRYLDDDFPSAPIDYRVTESPYESREEYLWFVERMREEIRSNTKGA